MNKVTNVLLALEGLGVILIALVFGDLFYWNNDIWLGLFLLPLLFFTLGLGFILSVVGFFIGIRYSKKDTNKKYKILYRISLILAIITVWGMFNFRLM